MQHVALPHCAIILLHALEVHEKEPQVVPEPDESLLYLQSPRVATVEICRLTRVLGATLSLIHI